MAIVFYVIIPLNIWRYVNHTVSYIPTGGIEVIRQMCPTDTKIDGSFFLDVVSAILSLLIAMGRLHSYLRNHW